MSDEGLREIQLNGKQMVFLFMTATVIAVGIFLCGVLVGRGVPLSRTEVTVINDGADPTVGAVPLVTTTPPPSTSERADSTSADLVYDEQLGTPEPVVENLAAPAPSPSLPVPSKTVPPKTVSSKSPSPKPAVPPSVAARPPAAASSAVAGTAVQDPAGGSFVVQVAAVRARAEAETIRRRLAGKGYRAFVTTATGAGVTMYRVRVGGYDSRRAADTAATKLEREERFKTWVTR